MKLKTKIILAIVYFLTATSMVSAEARGGILVPGGGTGLTSIAPGYVLMGSTSPYYLTSVSSTTFTGGGGTPAGADGNIQVNCSSAFCGSSAFTLDNGTSPHVLITTLNVSFGAGVDFQNNGISNVGSLSFSNFSGYLFSPGAGSNITATYSPTFSNLTATGTLSLSALTGTQCLHEISGVVSGTGSDCGSGGGYLSNSGANTYINTGTNLQAPTLNATSTTGTSTFANSINLSGLSNTSTSTAGQIIIGTSTPFVASASDVTTSEYVSMWGDSLTDGQPAYNGTITSFFMTQKLLNSTFINAYDMGFGGQNTQYIVNRFINSPNRWNDFTILWVGQNDIPTYTPVATGTAIMVAALPNPKHYIVMSVLGATVTGGTLTALLAYNTSIGVTYPGHYWDVRTFLTSTCNAIGTSSPFTSYGVNNTTFYASTTQDQTDCTANKVPQSLRYFNGSTYDTVHLSTQAYNLIAIALAPIVNAQVTLTPNTVLPAYTYAQFSNLAQSANDYFASTSLNDYFLGAAGTDRYNNGTSLQNNGQAGGILTGTGNLGVGPGFNRLTSGSNNTAFGYENASYLTTGSGNVFMGVTSGQLMNTGSNNVCVGLSSCTNSGAANGNVAIGNSALAQGNTSNNVMIGEFAGYSTNSFGQNVYIGDSAGQYTDSGNRNTFVGFSSGNIYLAPDYTKHAYVSSGIFDTFLGMNSSISTSTFQPSYASALGAQAIVGCSNCMVLGGAGVNGSYYENVGIGTTTPDAVLTLQGQQGFTNTFPLFDVYAATSTPGGVFMITNTANVGIGTTTPDSSLDVKGTVRFEGSSSVETAAIGGAIVGVGCDTGNTTLPTGLTVGSTTAFVTTPEADPGNVASPYTIAISSTVIQTKVCSGVTVTPNSVKYIVKIIK